MPRSRGGRTASRETERWGILRTGRTRQEQAGRWVGMWGVGSRNADSALQPGGTGAASATGRGRERGGSGAGAARERQGPPSSRATCSLAAVGASHRAGRHRCIMYLWARRHPTACGPRSRLGVTGSESAGPMPAPPDLHEQPSARHFFRPAGRCCRRHDGRGVSLSIGARPYLPP